MAVRPVGRRRFLGAVAVGATASLAGRWAWGASAQEQYRGFVLPTWEQHGYRDVDTRGALLEVRGTGADWVQIVPTWYQDSAGATDIRPTAGSVGSDDVRLAISLAHDAGLRVMLKPHVDVLSGTDRARITPTDRDAWFRSYRAFLGLWATLAEQEGVEEFCVGTELGSLAGDRGRWLDVVADTRTRFTRPLVYAADDYTGVAFWDAVDIAGIDAYWPLASRPTTDVGELERALVPIRDRLALFSARTGKRVLFTEAGFPSQSGAAVEPWNDRRSTAPAPQEQAAAYTAMLSTFSGQPWWAGVFWWTWTAPQVYPPTIPLALDHSVRAKPAADVVRAAWRRT